MDQSPAWRESASRHYSGMQAMLAQDCPAIEKLVAILYRRVGAPLPPFSKRASPRGDAEDLMQDAVLRFVAAARRQEIEAPIAFYRRIAANVRKDMISSGAARIRRQCLPLHEAYDLVDTDDPHRTAAARQELDIWRVRLATLPKQTLQIFTLHRLDGLTYTKIAQQLGIPRWQVQKHMARARGLVNGCGPKPPSSLDKA